MNKDEPILAIRCMTYNHGPYIRQCLEGFVMQKTDFPFIAVVHDDASTDGTADIIREFEEKYPDIIKAIYETENQWSKHDGSLGKIVDAATPECVKYIAYCEGDDYWTDPNKLQMQVDFLERNPEYGMCYGRAKRFIQKYGKFVNVIGDDYIDFETLLDSDSIPTLTTVVRKKLNQKYYEEIRPREHCWKMGDYPKWLWFSKNSKIKYFSEIFAVYRILPQSASHSQNVNETVEFEKSVYDVKKFFANLYNSQKNIPQFNEHFVRASFYVVSGNRKEALKEFKAIDIRTTKIKILTFACSNFAFFYTLKLYYRTRYGS